MNKNEVKQLMKKWKMNAHQAVKLIVNSMIHEVQNGKALLTREEKEEIRRNHGIQRSEFRRLWELVKDVLNHYLMCNSISLERSNVYLVLLHLIMDYLQHIKMLLFSKHLVSNETNKKNELLVTHYLSMRRRSINLVGIDLELFPSIEELQNVSIMSYKTEVCGLLDKCLQLEKDYREIFDQLVSDCAWVFSWEWWGIYRVLI